MRNQTGKNMAFIRYCLFPLLLVTSLSHAEMSLEELISTSTPLLPEQISVIAKQISEAANKGDDAILRKSISSQYLASGDKLKAFLEKNGKDTKDFDKRILSDFTFYSPVAVNNVILDKNIAFVQLLVSFNPTFVQNRHKSDGKTQQSESVWNSMGGKLFSLNWEIEGKGTATYYFVRQNNLWKLHCVYFSAKPMTTDQIEKVKPQMAALAEGNSI